MMWCIVIIVMASFTQMSREDSQLSFERLITSSNSVETSAHSDGRVRKQLHAAARKIDHLTEVLRESEANSMRLGDQAKLLKEEIRRWGVFLWGEFYLPLWRQNELPYSGKPGNMARRLGFYLPLTHRLERNQEREESVSNLEYLKNVVLKVWE